MCAGLRLRLTVYRAKRDASPDPSLEQCQHFTFMLSDDRYFYAFFMGKEPCRQGSFGRLTEGGLAKTCQ